METEVVIWILYIPVRFLLHFDLSCYPLLLSKTHYMIQIKITETAVLAVHGDTYEANIHSLSHLSGTEGREGGLESFHKMLHHMKKFESRCLRTDGFPAFVQPPNFTLGGHWNDEMNHLWAGWCDGKRPRFRYEDLDGIY